jgi:hypothetical protein
LALTGRMQPSPLPAPFRPTVPIWLLLPAAKRNLVHGCGPPLAANLGIRFKRTAWCLHFDDANRQPIGKF